MISHCFGSLVADGSVALGYFFVSFAVVALCTAGLQVVEVMPATVHDWHNVVYVVGWFATVVAGGVALQNDAPVAFVFWV